MYVPEWRRLARIAANAVGTPCYLIAEGGICENLRKLESLETTVPLRHWLSMKSQPVEKLLHLACDSGMGIDVVSEFEFLAAMEVGYPEGRILINGVGKIRWLPRYRQKNLIVHFDSLAEVEGMVGMARDLNWRVGLRCAIPLRGRSSRVRGRLHWDQFGMTRDELASAVVTLKKAGVQVSGLHFHLQVLPRKVGDYRDAIERLAEIAEELAINPEYIDIGGGIPLDGEWTTEGVSLASQFDMDQFRDLLSRVPVALPSIQEIWMENGRFLSGSAGVLVIGVVEKKERDGITYLICDGGRVNHARLAAFERHELLLSPMQEGVRTPTLVCGPTCGAVDQLGLWELPESIRPGDLVIWSGAGAYHIPLETRFSAGLAPVVWFNSKDELEVIRGRESAGDWWGQWRVAALSVAATG